MKIATTEYGRTLIAKPNADEIADLAEAYALGTVLQDYNSALTWNAIMNRLQRADDHCQTIEAHFGDDLQLYVEYQDLDRYPAAVADELLRMYSLFVSFANELHSR